jgi:hypothetical protein
VSHPTLAELEAHHLQRLRARVQAEAAADGTVWRPRWGEALRDSEAGRRRIARRLAELDYWWLTRPERGRRIP